MQNKFVFLIGMPGCGKSTIGNRIATDLAVNFIDLDVLITTQNGISVTAYFEQFGAYSFRKTERVALDKLSTDQAIIVATGGGTPCYFDNLNQMKQKGLVIWLDCSLDTLTFRNLPELEKRPLFKGLDEVSLRKRLAHMLAERHFYYRQADQQFQIDQDEEYPNLLNYINSWLKQG